MKNYARYVNLLAAFQRGFPQLSRHPKVYGARIEFFPELRLVISVPDAREPPILEFPKKVILKKQSLPVRFATAEPAELSSSWPEEYCFDDAPPLTSAQEDVKTALAGTNVVSPNVSEAGAGTLGWSFLTPSHREIFLSNWHVLYGKNDPLDPQNPVRLKVLDTDNGYNIGGELIRFDPVESGQDVTFDFALARYIADLHPGEFRTFQCGRPPYPLKLSSDVFPGENYWVFGRASQARRGRLVGVGFHTIVGGSSDPGVPAFEASFVNQLFFEQNDSNNGFYIDQWMTAPGDSGAIIVREEDWSVTGLNFARVAQVDRNGVTRYLTIANPLLTRGWIFKSTVTLDNGATLPVLDIGIDDPAFRIFAPLKTERKKPPIPPYYWRPFEKVRFRFDGRTYEGLTLASKGSLVQVLLGAKHRIRARWFNAYKLKPLNPRRSKVKASLLKLRVAY